MRLALGRRWVRNLFFCWSILTPELIYSQRVADTAFVQAAARHSIELYTRSIGVESHLYNGVLYKEYNFHPADDGSPYFISDDWQEGSVYYDRELYESAPLMYDQVKDKLIVEHEFGGVKLELISEKVGWFTLGDHRFVRLIADKLTPEIQTGFHESLYEGNLKVYARRHKNFQETVVNRQEVAYIFKEAYHYYIFKDGHYHPVRSKRSVLKLLEDRKADVRRFMHKNKIRFRADRGRAIAQVVAFYDQTIVSK